MKVVVLGGYGNFGARICRALAGTSGIELVIAGRDLSAAAAFAAELGGTATALRIDATQAGLAQTLREAGAGLVIHTAGPFQQQDYRVPLAAAAAGAHYVDLADGRRFVCDFVRNLDAAFRDCGRLAISGASTVPALSSAVINHLTTGWTRIDEIDFCIAPAQTAPRGVATMAAVLNYCGAPIQVWRDNAWTTCYGWQNPQPVHFARLRSRIGAICDIPDLEIFPATYKGVKSVVFRAALEVGLTQRALSVIATLRRHGFIGRPDRLAHLLNRTARFFDFAGSSLGGMVVRVTGVDAAGAAVRRSWHIAADNDHGPEIPCMAAILLARSLARNEIAGVGAHVSTGWLALPDFEPEFARWNMLTDVVEEAGL